MLRGYYNFFKETRLRLDYPPYNQTRWFAWLDSPQNIEDLNKIYTRNIKKMGVPYIPSYKEGVEFYNRYYKDD